MVLKQHYWEYDSSGQFLVVTCHGMLAEYSSTQMQASIGQLESSLQILQAIDIQNILILKYTKISNKRNNN